jgi:hypothetical protein
MAWDSNSDKQIDKPEFEKAFQSMNLDNVREVRNLEVAAYLYRNQYIVCRPVSGQVLSNLAEKE